MRQLQCVVAGLRLYAKAAQGGAVCSSSKGEAAHRRFRFFQFDCATWLEPTALLLLERIPDDNGSYCAIPIYPPVYC